jgi:outer membrane protein OmpA-like peptidoglycan-associated protein
MSLWKVTSLLFCLAIVPISSSLTSCASKPAELKSIPLDANPIAEIGKTQQMIEDGRANQLDVLSPNNFVRAQNALKNAMTKNDRSESTEKVLEQVSIARAWLYEAKEKAQIATLQLKDIADARRGSLNAKANEFFPKDWSHAESDLTKATKQIEKGKFKLAEKNADEILAQFRKLEVDSVIQKHLSKTKDNILFAEKVNAKIAAPISYKDALSKLDEAIEVIKKDPRNQRAIKTAALEASSSGQNLVDITQKIRLGKTEEILLQAESQRRTISNLRRENRSAEEQLRDLEQRQIELERTQNLLNQSSAIRKALDPNEAEVFAENGRIVVRMKALQFAGNKATLNKKNEALLKKLNQALITAVPSKVFIQAHTDSLGNTIRNKNLSVQRAKSVQDFLVANGAVNLKNVESVGLGDTNPISDNTTAAGRSLNRRIEVIIEPSLKK